MLVRQPPCDHFGAIPAPMGIAFAASLPMSSAYYPHRKGQYVTVTRTTRYDCVAVRCSPQRGTHRGWTAQTRRRLMCPTRTDQPSRRLCGTLMRRLRRGVERMRQNGPNGKALGSLAATSCQSVDALRIRCWRRTTRILLLRLGDTSAFNYSGRRIVVPWLATRRHSPERRTKTSVSRSLADISRPCTFTCR
jgi:hypothetical protein